MKLKWSAMWVALCFLCAAAWADTEGTQAQRELRHKLALSAERGNAEAEYHLGMLYNSGLLGVAQDLPRAYRSFARSAALGDPLGAYKQGCYLAGQFPGVVPLDPSRALEHKLVAARAGYDLAQFDVASIYFQQGLYAQAQQWLQLAADQGRAMALFNLSVGHVRGQWPASDRALGYAYFKLAKLVAEGSLNPKAEASLDELARQMSPEQLAQANALVAAWKPQPSALTSKARQGIAAAQALANLAP